MKATIITIGDEILIGQIIDTNSAWLAESLQALDIEVQRIVSISDTEEEIKQALTQNVKEVDLVILTGGLGPTKDDITKKAIADFLGLEMIFDDDLYNNIKEIFKRYGREATEAHRLQSYMPSNTQKLANNMGTAPGMLFESNGCMILSMPGVPYEMKYIFEKSFVPIIQERSKKLSVYHKTIHTAGQGETYIAERIESIVDAFPDYIKMAYLPSLGKVRLRMSGKHVDGDRLKAEIESYGMKIQEELAELVFGFDGDSLESKVCDICVEKNLKVATAESCTGGNIARTLVSVSGASNYFQGAVVSYSNELKQKLLNVDPDTLKTHGAVSKETVEEMVIGALAAMDVDLAVAVSGIAGPGGGSKEKPVGTIHLACGNGEHMMHRKLQLSKTRQLNIDYSTNIAILLIYKFVKKYYS